MNRKDRPLSKSDEIEFLEGLVGQDWHYDLNGFLDATGFVELFDAQTRKHLQIANKMIRGLINEELPEYIYGLEMDFSKEGVQHRVYPIVLVVYDDQERVEVYRLSIAENTHYLKMKTLYHFKSESIITLAGLMVFGITRYNDELIAVNKITTVTYNPEDD